jgi:3-dehydroquinate synthase
MQARFPYPLRTTRVRKFRSRKALRAAVGEARMVLDGGVPEFEFSAPPPFRVPGGEDSKRWIQIEGILGWLARLGTERSASLYVIGGGATLDLGAFAASLYRRGMPLVLVPTTLLGMVDATLGGKTAVDGEVNGRLLKNFAGTFYPASEIWLCFDFLRTLAPRERVSGAGEVYKTMWIRGGKWDEKALVRFVETGEVSPALEKIILECLKVKARLVEKDPLDTKRVREVLNFGHTVGHALESAAVGKLSHGECVLWGMVIESELLGRSGEPMCAKAKAALGALKLDFPLLRPEHAWAHYLGADKKTKKGILEMSLLTAPGKVVKKRFEPAVVAAAIANFRG